MLIIFWLAAAFVLYVYAGYPAALWIWARLRAQRPTPAVAPAPVGVTIVIAARNEGHRLRTRLENLLQLDHPDHLRQIVVVSDGSTDDTAAVVNAFGDRVELVSVPSGGKARALNAGVARARFDVLVFTDARQLFAEDAIRHLTTPLEDPSVAAVTGELVLDCESRWRRMRDVDRRRASRPSSPDRRTAAPSAIAAGIGVYWQYEKALRRLESTVASTLGATGAIYAMRRALWTPLPPDTILDDVLAPMRAVLAGFRVVFNPLARAFDCAAVDADAESRRKIRTLTGNYQILWLEPRLLVPWRNPVWLQYMSHKVGRLLVPHALVLLFASGLTLGSHPFYLAALIGQCAFYLLAGYGAWLELKMRAAAPVAPDTRAVALPARKEAVNA